MKFRFDIINCCVANLECRIHALQLSQLIIECNQVSVAIHCTSTSLTEVAECLL